MAKALYRKYRPKKLSDVIGEEQVTNVLANSLKQGKISHAYLFVGPRGTGKTSVARIFAHEVNGFEYELEDSHVDIIEIDGASNRGIDNIRELREKVAIAPTTGKYKIYIIDEVHMLTREAFNALLKTLEEPPAHVIFIMATTDVYKVPVTITSRAQTYTFNLADKKVMFDYLKSICEKEKIKISDDALQIIVKRGGGSFRDSLSLLDQISTLTSDEITKDLVVSAMGLPQDEVIKKLLNDYILQDIKVAKEDIKNVLTSGVKVETVVSEMVSTIIESPKPELMPLLKKLPDVRAPFAEAKLLVAIINVDEPSIIAPKKPIIQLRSNEVRPAPVRFERPAPARFESQATEKPALDKSVTDKPIDEPKTTDVAKKPEPEPAMPFDWEAFLLKVQELNDAIYLQLKTVSYELTGSGLNIYPSKKIEKTILSRENNLRVLAEASGGHRIVIHEVGDKRPESQDLLISKMSAIMGGEVQNDGGGTPF